MTPSRLKDTVVQLVADNLKDAATASGDALYSGWDTLREGPLYLMGLNPGGDPAIIRTSVLDSLELVRATGYSAYEDQCWRRRCSSDCKVDRHRGAEAHQQRVRKVVELFGLAPRQVFSANALFLRTPSGKLITDVEELWRRCWPVHQYFLAQVRPRVIICLGNGVQFGASSFALLRSRCATADDNRDCTRNGFRDGRIFRGTFTLGTWGTLSSTVLGIPHPSRFPVTEAMKNWIAQEREPGLLWGRQRS